MNPNLKGMFTNVINSGSNFINTFVDSSDKESDFLYDSFKSEGYDVDKDLIRHYVLSRNITNQFGPAKKLTGTITSLQAGLFKEFLDGAGALAGRGPTKGRATAFSVDDLGADIAGATRMPLDMALAKGLFKHTEPGVTGIGQGKPMQVLKNVLSDEKTNAKDKIK
jgi:hypothetical protein